MVTNEQAVSQPAVPKVAVAVASEQGRREENQDWYSWTQSPLGELFVIADGMGGYKGGALAAKMTVDIVERGMSEAPQEWSFGRAATEALAAANQEVHRLAHSGNPDTENMGSTALVVLLSEGRAQIAHVGDSRAYLLRDGELQLLTRDHTRVQQMIDAKMLTPEQARHHPEGHLLSRAIGSRADVEVEITGPFPLKKGDGLLLCSDGLSGFVSDDKIRATLQKQRDVQRVPEDLVNLALSEGGNDNITIQFVRVDGTVRERVTAKMPVKMIREQGRSRDAFVVIVKRAVPVFATLAAVAVLAVFVIFPNMRPVSSTAPANTSPTPPGSRQTAPPPPASATVPALLPATAGPLITAAPNAPRASAAQADARVSTQGRSSGTGTSVSTQNGRASTPSGRSNVAKKNGPSEAQPGGGRSTPPPPAGNGAPVAREGGPANPPPAQPPAANDPQPPATTQRPAPGAETPPATQQPASPPPPDQSSDQPR